MGVRGPGVSSNTFSIYIYQQMLRHNGLVPSHCFTSETLVSPFLVTVGPSSPYKRISSERDWILKLLFILKVHFKPLNPIIFCKVCLFDTYIHLYTLLYHITSLDLSLILQSSFWFVGQILVLDKSLFLPWSRVWRIKVHVITKIMGSFVMVI